MQTGLLVKKASLQIVNLGVIRGGGREREVGRPSTKRRSLWGARRVIG